MSVLGEFEDWEATITILNMLDHNRIVYESDFLSEISSFEKRMQLVLGEFMAILFHYRRLSCGTQTFQRRSFIEHLKDFSS